MFLMLLEIIAAVIIGVTVMTQIVIPMWNGATLFPALRKQGALESALHEVRQEYTEAELQEKLSEARQALEHKTQTKAKE